MTRMKVEGFYEQTCLRYWTLRTGFERYGFTASFGYLCMAFIAVLS